ncbi:MAG TPA: hypothetical protein VGM18_19610 [Candidatus Sulfotelmatobacter sp.]|jgi:hypothetical protein
MLRLTNPENGLSKRWCAVVVLFAVCALTVSVATRYNFARGRVSGSATTVHKHISPERARQRLIKTVASWIPVSATAVMQAPSSYPRIAPSGPPIASLLFEKSLYKRPPPALKSLS